MRKYIAQNYFIANCQLPLVFCLLPIACCLLPVISLFFFAGCNSTYTSKKRGYFKVDFPERKYIKFDKPGFPYSFEYPGYASIVKDSAYFDSTSDNPYWVNVDFPTFHGKIYISYKTIGGKSIYKVKTPAGYKDSVGLNVLNKMVNDAYNLAYKNDIKAYSIEDSVVHTPNNIAGIYFRLSGEVASARQFFLTDTTKHFLRGAMYFYVAPKEDSLKPVIEFLQEDMKHLINTVQWR